MNINPRDRRWDRRQVYDLDYFANGGLERRSGPWGRRSSRDRRSGTDRRLVGDSEYTGPERRRGIERRTGKERRSALV